VTLLLLSPKWRLKLLLLPVLTENFDFLCTQFPYRKRILDIYLYGLVNYNDLCVHSDLVNFTVAKLDYIASLHFYHLKTKATYANKTCQSCSAFRVESHISHRENSSGISSADFELYCVIYGLR